MFQQQITLQQVCQWGTNSSSENSVWLRELSAHFCPISTSPIDSWNLVYISVAQYIFIYEKTFRRLRLKFTSISLAKTEAGVALGVVFTAQLMRQWLRLRQRTFSSTAFFQYGGLSWDKAANWLAENQFIHFIPTKDAIFNCFFGQWLFSEKG